ncbi:efflux RND transporter periplasmic adaptor subunit [Inhella gelatinilytica]|uniref:Efflux RND transporter periplasmic adaptor subunit n=1 Tax=Inhella gelatinilytica TaxID=2795030 RepID=A0A931NFS9_9BURK|nr:efflux RND transporter periplasmic adaptor subunit [Inhella gelatinilytica]MBH9553866.1 efflux RND transporter periplasmic adaptor subunit [Inhella gelatinilytica]
MQVRTLTQSRNRLWTVGGLTVLALAVAATFAVGASADPTPKKEEKKADKVLRFSAAEVVQPQLETLRARIEFSGPLVAPNTAIVRAKGGGTLLALTAPEGSRVKAGQSLGTLDLEDLRQRVNERAASVEAMRAQATQVERSHQANESLARQNFIAPTALETSRSQLDTARANLAAAQAQLQTVQVTLRQASLTAPINGWVAKRHAVPGEKLQLEQAVVTVVDLSQLELAGLVGTHEVSRLKPGMVAKVQIEGQSEPVQARVARISPAAEAGTRSIGVTLTVPNPSEQLRAGQYAVATVTLDDPAPRLTVPTTALVGSTGQQAVWVIDQGALKRRLVTTGRTDAQEGRVEILTGVDAKAQILAAQYPNLREGTKAQIDATASKVAALDR